MAKLVIIIDGDLPYSGGISIAYRIHSAIEKAGLQSEIVVIGDGFISTDKLDFSKLHGAINPDTLVAAIIHGGNRLIESKDKKDVTKVHITNSGPTLKFIKKIINQSGIKPKELNLALFSCHGGTFAKSVGMAKLVNFLLSRGSGKHGIITEQNIEAIETIIDLISKGLSYPQIADFLIKTDPETYYLFFGEKRYKFSRYGKLSIKDVRVALLKTYDESKDLPKKSKIEEIILTLTKSGKKLFDTGSIFKLAPELLKPEYNKAVETLLSDFSDKFLAANIQKKLPKRIKPILPESKDVDKKVQPKSAAKKLLEISVVRDNQMLANNIIISNPELVDKNSSNNICSEIIILAVLNKTLSMLKFLVDEIGIDVNSETRGGMTALMEASQKANPEAVRFLLSRGAKVTIGCVFEAFDKGKKLSKDRIDIAMELFRNGASMVYYFESDEGQNILHIAGASKFKSLIEDATSLYNLLGYKEENLLFEDSSSDDENEELDSEIEEEKEDKKEKSDNKDDNKSRKTIICYKLPKTKEFDSEKINQIVQIIARNNENRQVFDYINHNKPRPVLLECLINVDQNSALELNKLLDVFLVAGDILKPDYQNRTILGQAIYNIAANPDQPIFAKIAARIIKLNKEINPTFDSNQYLLTSGLSAIIKHPQKIMEQISVEIEKIENPDQKMVVKTTTPISKTPQQIPHDQNQPR